jgi:hypothetical protein
MFAFDGASYSDPKVPRTTCLGKVTTPRLAWKLSILAVMAQTTVAPRRGFATALSRLRTQPKGLFKKVYSRRFIQEGLFKKVYSRRFIQEGLFKKVYSRRFIQEGLFKIFHLNHKHANQGQVLGRPVSGEACGLNGSTQHQIETRGLSILSLEQDVRKKSKVVRDPVNGLNRFRWLANGRQSGNCPVLGDLCRFAIHADD